MTTEAKPVVSRPVSTLERIESWLARPDFPLKAIATSASAFVIGVLFEWAFPIFAKAAEWDVKLSAWLESHPLIVPALKALAFLGIAVLMLTIAWHYGYRAALKNDQLSNRRLAEENRRTSILSTRRFRVGESMLRLSNEVRPQSIANIRFPMTDGVKTEVLSMHALAGELGVPLPPAEGMQQEDNRYATADLLQVVGRLMYDGAFDAAVEQARRRVEIWPKRLLV